MKTKLFPHNLTAQAAHIVEGNPATSRPESGTDVCTPGLEIDLRTLEERFFPGFQWDYERQDGAKLVDMDSVVNGLKREECIGPDIGVYLWAMYGRLHGGGDDFQFIGFNGAQGRTVWRRVRDLANGRVAILFGNQPSIKNPSQRQEAETCLTAVMNATTPQGSVCIRRSDGKFRCAVMAANRLEYLNDAGVIVGNFEPGELTKSLCSPWQFDFRDCGCQYWAAGKPDIVRSNYPDIRFQNYSRKRDQHEKLPDTASFRERGKVVYSPGEIVSGAWQALPTVLGDQERDEWIVAKDGHPASDLFSREEAAGELCYLATVEHALLVEYLFATYSVNTAVRGDSEAHRKVHKASVRSADVVKSIAIDEMRHFLWVNQLLQILGWNPSTGRAKVLGADPKRVKKGGAGCRRKRVNINYSHTAFKVCPLTERTLQSFLDIEKNSQTLDGMYARLYASVAQQHDQFPEHERLLPLLKLIMDEGEDHYQRFVVIQKSLDSMNHEEWLLDLHAPEDSEQKVTYEIAAAYYHLLLHTISTAFRLESGGATLLTMIRELMAELDELITKLASEGIKFDWPLPDEVADIHHPLPHEIDQEELNTTLSQLESRRAAIIDRIKSIKASSPYSETLMKQAPRILSLFAETGAAIRNELVRSGDRPSEKKSCLLCEYEEPKPREC